MADPVFRYTAIPDQQSMVTVMELPVKDLGQREAGQIGSRLLSFHPPLMDWTRDEDYQNTTAKN